MCSGAAVLPENASHAATAGCPTPPAVGSVDSRLTVGIARRPFYQLRLRANITSVLRTRRKPGCCTCRRARLSSNSSRALCKEDAQQELGGGRVARLRQMFAETEAVSVVYTSSRPRLFSLRVISDSNEASPQAAE